MLEELEAGDSINYHRQGTFREISPVSPILESVTLAYVERLNVGEDDATIAN